jgi:hypothetical protein
MPPADDHRKLASVAAHGLAALALMACLSAASGAVAASTDVIYTCTDGAGKRHTADRLIAECMGREQRVLGRDGTLVRVIPPTLTPAERAEVEAREQRRLAEREKQQELVRRDRNLLQRYPNEAVHAEARAASLESARQALRVSQERLQRLAVERKPLTSETEFYVGKALPPELKQKIDANDAAVEAQRSLIQNQQAEIERINSGYDTELARLKKLWGGATPGSLGPIETAAAPAAKTARP